MWGHGYQHYSTYYTYQHYSTLWCMSECPTMTLLHIEQHHRLNCEHTICDQLCICIIIFLIPVVQWTRVTYQLICWIAVLHGQNGAHRDCVPT